MAEFLVSASTGAMSSLLKKLATMLGNEYKLHKDVRKDIEFMKDELEAMHTFLLKMAEIEDPDVQAKLRVRVVRELSYDIEDYIDKFMVHVDRDPSSRTHGFKDLIDKSKNLLTKVNTQHQIAKEIKVIKKQVIEVSERFARYKVDEGTSKPQIVNIDPRVRTIYKDASELIGIDGPTDELLNCLIDEEGELAKQLKVVSIVGFGGLGKTTLANQVYCKLSAKFECRAFVSISRIPDMMKVLKSLLSQICNQKYVHADTWDEQQIINTIRELLENKRYLIIVDDIWSIPTWEIMGCAFPKGGYSSRIITTTRKIDVAHCCSSHDDLVYRIKPLSNIDSKRLFLKRIFGREEGCPSNLEEASNAILKKCGGLPLAIVTTSSLLANKQTTDQWDQVQRSIGYALADNSDFECMNKILSLSYFDLPQHLRTCLLCVTIFPEDYEIPRMYLVHRWIAEGFIHGDTRENLYKLGDSYFYEFINRSLIQPADIRRGGEARCCQVHDTIHDFLMSKSTEENFAATINYPQITCFPSPAMKIRRLSLTQSHNQADIVTSPNWNISQLRSLTIFGSVKQMPSFSNFSILRVLDLRYCTGLENYHIENVTKLSQLTYLTIRGEKITELPQRIGDLQCLEMLDVLQTSVKELPRSTLRLQRLVVLYVQEGAKLPDGFGKMYMLEELVWIGVFRYSMNFLEELGELKSLRNLSIEWDIERVEGDKVSYKEKLASALRKLDACNLRHLSISIHLRNEDDFSSSFLALNSITSFIVRGENISKVNKWLGSLFNLKRVVLTVKEIDQDDLWILGNIPNLTNLELCLSPDQNQSDIIIRRIQGFQQLDLFSFCSVHTGLMFEAGSMPNLGRLSLGIKAVKFMSACGDLRFGIQHLSCLTMVSITIDRAVARLPYVEAAEDAFKSMVQAHPNRPTLNIRTENLCVIEDEEDSVQLQDP